MAYLEGSAIDRAELLDNFLDFLAANGWTRTGDEIENSEGTTFAFAITDLTTRNPYGSSSVHDYSFGVKIKTDSFGPSGYSAIKYSNDFSGPFAVTYFFTDGITAACVVKSGNLKYSHIVFGHLDSHDLYTAKVPFIAGVFFEWWRSQENYYSDGNDNGMNWIQADRHSIGYFGENGNCLALVPDGVVDPSLGFTDGLHYPSWLPTCQHFTYAGDATAGGNGATGYYLDHFTAIWNQSMTGGVPLHSMPVIANNGVLCFLGDMPLVRLVNIIGLSPAQVVSFAGDDWVVFPFKQAGDLNAQAWGATPLPILNTGYYGLAFKK